MKQKEIALAVGMSEAELSRFLNQSKYGRKVSWRRAVELNQLFPQYSVKYWRTATSDKLHKRLSSLVRAAK